MNWFLLIIFSWFGNSAVPDGTTTKVSHDFYVSTTVLNVDTDKGLMTGVAQFFPDDWERIMNAYVAEKVVRFSQLSTDQRQAMQATYLEERLKISLGDQPLQVHYEGYDEGPNEVLLLFTVAYGSRSSKELMGPWNIHFDALSEIYPNQENIITVRNAGKQKTNSCRSSNNYTLKLQL
jgi:hypothetical protein